MIVETAIGIVGIVVTIISIIVTGISIILQSSEKHKHEKSNRPDQG